MAASIAPVSSERPINGHDKRTLEAYVRSQQTLALIAPSTHARWSAREVLANAAGTRAAHPGTRAAPAFAEATVREDRAAVVDSLQLGNAQATRTRNTRHPVPTTSVPVAGAGCPIERYQVLDQLTLLVDKSLIATEDSRGRTRYRLLETVRQYAAEKLGELR